MREGRWSMTMAGSGRRETRARSRVGGDSSDGGGGGVAGVASREGPEEGVAALRAAEGKAKVTLFWGEAGGADFREAATCCCTICPS